MTTINGTIDDIAAAVIDAFPKLSATERRVSLALYRLLARGRPAKAEQISAASGVPTDAVRSMIGRWHGVERSQGGAVIAFWGLTLSETKHRFRVEGRELHTWCAWDTLFLPPLLGATADVESPCAASGTRIALKIGPSGVEASRPETVALSFLTPRESDVEKNVIETFCCYVHFFASREYAERWTAGHPGTFLLSLNEAWEVGVRKNAAQFPDFPSVHAVNRDRTGPQRRRRA